MKFAENNRISQRQLYRQIVIAFIAPFLLCLFRGLHQESRLPVFLPVSSRLSDVNT